MALSNNGKLRMVKKRSSKHQTLCTKRHRFKQISSWKLRNKLHQKQRLVKKRPVSADSLKILNDLPYKRANQALKGVTWVSNANEG